MAEGWHEPVHSQTQSDGSPPQANPKRPTVHSKVAVWNKKDQLPEASASQSPSSYHGILNMQRISGHKDSYGKPKEGTKTEYRGKQAGVRISNEIVELCSIIKEYGSHWSENTYAISFGSLFEIYTRISNKLVGMLMRARKQGLVEFQGEMLFQRRDDDVMIKLVKLPQDLVEDIERRKQELEHHTKRDT